MCNLFKLLLDVGVRLQFELPARVRPVHQEQPLLGVHLFDQDGRFLVVSHLKMKYMLDLKGTPLMVNIQICLLITDSTSKSEKQMY